MDAICVCHELPNAGALDPSRHSELAPSNVIHGAASKHENTSNRRPSALTIRSDLAIVPPVVHSCRVSGYSGISRPIACQQLC
jgi:hypothetical protein